MRASAILASASAVLATSNTSAPIVASNPIGAAYTATLPAAAFDAAAYPSGGNVVGSISAVSAADGTGVEFQVAFSNLPATGGPFTYHIHARPVPDNGNCTATGAHLDPYVVGEAVTCNSADKASCQVGDLTGKWGKVTSDPFTAAYTDVFASTDPTNAGFFGNLSFVLHYPNKTRITCANFVSAAANGSSPTVVPTGSSPSASGFHTPTPSSSGAPFTAGASANRATALGAVAVGLAVLML